MPDFTPELDAYEREATRRLDPLAARHARAELAAHLAADVEARIELGAAPEEARAQALAALGDLRQVARRERADHRDLALQLAPGLFVVAYALQAALIQDSSTRFVAMSILEPNVLIAAPAIMAVIAAAFGSRERTSLRLGPLLRGWTAAVVTAPFVMMVSGARSTAHELGTLAAIAFWSAVPALLSHLSSIVLGPIACSDQSPSGGWTARLLAWPVGMAIVGHARVLYDLVPWAWPLTGLLLMLGMLGRRRPDVPVAIASTLLGLLANGRLESVLLGRWGGPIESALHVGLSFAMLLLLQTAAIGFWSLLRDRRRIVEDA